MTFPDPGITETLKEVLAKNPGGITISGIAKKTKLNRNLIAKYLDYLRLSGQLEMKHFGSSKVYSVASRIPVSTLVNYAFDPVLMLDEEQRIVGANDPFLSLFGEKRDSGTGKKVSDIRNMTLVNLVQDILSVSPGEQGSITPEIVIRIGNDLRYFKNCTLPVVYEDGKSGTAIILHEVTAEKTCQMIQYLEGARQDTLMEDLSDLVVRFRPEGEIVFMNRAALRFLQKKPGEFSGMMIDSLVIHEDLPKFKTVLEGIRKNSPVGTCTCRILDPDGGIHPFSWTIRGIFDQTTRLLEFRGIGRDLTELREAEKKIDQFIADQWFLTRKAYEITGLYDDTDIYESIGRGIRDLLPNAIVAVNTVDLDQNCTITRCFLGEREREVFSGYLGEDVVGYVMSPPDSPERSHVIQNLMGGQFIKVPGNLDVMMMGQVSREVCEKIEKALNIGDMYVLGLSSQGILFGNIALLLPKGDVLEHSVVLEIFFRLSSLGLQCRHLKEAKELPVSWKPGGTANSR